MSFVSLSFPSLPAPMVTVLHKLLPSLPPTGRDVDVPPVYREPFVLSGYRPVGLSWRCCVLSLFQRHNDVVKVWCPLLAAVAVATRFLFFTVLQAGGVLGVRLQSPEGSGVSLDPSSLPLLLYVSSVVFGLCCSAASVLLRPRSRPVRSSLLLLDAVGRGVHQASRALALSVYSSDSDWTQSAAGQLYLPTAALLAWSSCISGCCVELYLQRSKLVHRRLLQGGPVLLGFLLDISPVVKRLHTWSSSPAVVLFLLAAVFLFCPVPECLSPGHFDILGHSLQLFQVLQTLSTLCQQEALLQDFSWRRAGLTRTFGEERLLGASAGLTVFALSCSATAVALRRCSGTR
ncbi:membrane progestin receptor beta-like [Eucyclogobius newberryi]|uniref:membrane progestin receptor beta-like n=1 Tax=Eucyclogobius newberryi TaxID=166745 RepID=UPI003B5A9086